MATGPVSAGAVADQVVIHLSGELNISTQQDLRVLLAPAVCGSTRLVVVDCAAVSFVDCAGLVPLRQAAVELRAREAQLVMPHPSAAVRRLVSLTGAAAALGLADEAAAC